MLELIVTHKNTDFDAFASLVAATLIYPGATAVIPKQVNPNVRGFWSLHKDLFEFKTLDEIDADQVSKVIMVDANRWERLDRPELFRDRADLIVEIWDHHPGDASIPCQWSSQEPVGATIVLLIRRLKALNLALSPIHATLFLAGLYEDTGNLTFPSTTAEDAAAAAYLLSAKADLNIVNGLLRPAYGQKQKEILFEMLKQTQRTHVNGHSLSFSKVDINGHVGNLAMVVRMYQDIVNVDSAFGIFKNRRQDRCIIIGRSRSDSIDIGAIMRAMGGGGHPGAGSVQLKSVNPEAVEQMITSLLAGNQQASVQVADLMSFPVKTIDADTPMAKVADILREEGCSGLPVLKAEQVVGVISRRDLAKARRQSQLTAPVKAFMQRDIKTIAPHESPLAVVRKMTRHDIGRLPVVKDGRLIGIVTRSDTLRYFYDLLPD